MPEDHLDHLDASGPLGEPEPEMPDESTRPVAVPSPDAIAGSPSEHAPQSSAVPAPDNDVPVEHAEVPPSDDDLGNLDDPDNLDNEFDEVDASAPVLEIEGATDSQDDDSAEESTRPKAPPGLREAILIQQAAEQQVVEPQPESPEPASTFAFPEPPRDPDDDTAEGAAVAYRPVPRLLLAVVVLGMACLCITLVGMAGFAGYRDGLATNDVKLTQTMATEIAAQYQAGLDDIEAGRYGLAMERLAWIIETVQPGPEYMRDSREQWARAATLNAITPTPLVTATPATTPTQEPLPLLTEEPAAAAETPAPVNQQDPAYMYQQAEQAAQVGDYETTIAWAESLRSVAPDYRPADVLAMLMDALTKQGTIYMRGANPDGEDKLLRGILLIYRAQDLGPVQPDSLPYEADFAERYLNARSYLDGGNAAAATPILERLCSENCGWSYRGVSVRDLVEEATGVRPD